ncbi:MAG: hypothetical protein LBP79_03985 [Clostridiales bacterium]|jgi:hypothetical protein|nr:hypothetical protein [Clostridiales bacterium]
MRLKQDETKTLKIKSRDAVVDNVKGLLVLMFAFVHIMRNLRYIDGFDLGGVANNVFYHSPPVAISWWGFNVLDLAPISFYFLIGFVIYRSFQKHYDKIGRGAYRQSLLRNLTVMGLFLLVLYIENVLDKSGNPSRWNYLVGIGFTGILTVPFFAPVFRKTGIAGALIKFGAAAAVLVLYSLLHDALFGVVGDRAGHGGGAASSFGFLSVVLFAAGVKDISTLGIKFYSAAAVVIYLSGLLVGNVLNVGISYDVFSAGYIFVAFTKVNLIFFILHTINKYALKERAIPFVSAIGRNILLYVLVVTALIGAMIALKGAGILPEMTLPAGLLTALGLDGLLVLLAVPLEKKKVMFKL